MATINYDIIKNIELAVSLNWQLRLSEHPNLMKTNFTELCSNLGIGENGLVNILCETCDPPKSTTEAPDAWIRGIRKNQAVQNKPSTTFELVCFDTSKLHIFKYFHTLKNVAMKMRNQANVPQTDYSYKYGTFLIDNLSGNDDAEGDLTKGNKEIIGTYKPDLAYPTEVRHSELNGDGSYIKTTVTFTYGIYDYVSVKN